MSITDEERLAIVDYRIEKSIQSLDEARRLFELSMYNLCANRLYYASFYASGALLIANELSAHTHTGVTALLHQHFVKPGKLSKEVAGTLKKNFSLRQQADYDGFVDIEANDLETTIPATAKTHRRDSWIDREIIL